MVYGGMAGCIYIMIEVLLDAVRLLLERFMRDWIGCAYRWSALHGKDIWVPMASGVMTLYQAHELDAAMMFVACHIADLGA